MPATQFAGFSPSEIAAYFGVSPLAAQGIINIAAGDKSQSLPANQLTALQALDPLLFKAGATTYNQGFGGIPWGLNHLAEHPKGSHYHGDFSVQKLIWNFATGGFYGIGSAALDVIEGGKVFPALKQGFASYGPAGSVLQPTIGTNKALLIEGAIATAALPFAYPVIGTVLAATGGIGAALLNQAKGAITNLVTGSSETGTPSADSRGVSPGSPIYPSSGNPTYFVSADSSPGSTLITGNGTPGGTPAPASPTPRMVSPAVLAVAAVVLLGVVLLIRRSRT